LNRQSEDSALRPRVEQNTILRQLNDGLAGICHHAASFSFAGMMGDLFEAIRYPTGLKQCMNRLTYLLAKLLFPCLPGDMRRRRLNNLFTILFISLIVMGGIVLAIIIMDKRSK